MVSTEDLFPREKKQSIGKYNYYDGKKEVVVSKNYSGKTMIMSSRFVKYLEKMSQDLNEKVSQKLKEMGY